MDFFLLLSSQRDRMRADALRAQHWSARVEL